MTLPEIRTLQRRGDCASYEIEPLQPGFGVTIGNALARVLRSLPGAAVVALRIEGHHGECQAIAGVREDLEMIVLNIKQVRLRCSSHHPVSMRLEVKGKRDVLAADIIVPDTIEILNPKLHIATLENKHARLALELVVQIGRGYVPAEELTVQPRDEGTIPIDAIYTPIRKASYTVERTRVGKMVNYDKVLFSIETDGTLSPDEALRQSAGILLRQFRAFTSTEVPVVKKTSRTDSAVVIPWNVYQLPLDALHLPPRIYQSFKRRSITNVGQILIMDEEEFCRIRNIGEKSIPAIVEALRAAGCFPSFLEGALHPE